MLNASSRPGDGPCARSARGTPELLSPNAADMHLFCSPQDAFTRESRWEVAARQHVPAAVWCSDKTVQSSGKAWVAEDSPMIDGIDFIQLHGFKNPPR